MGVADTSQDVVISRFGRALALVLWTICALYVVFLGLYGNEPHGSLLIAFFAVLIYAGFWSPRAVLDTDSVRVINPFRKWVVPFSAIQGIGSQWTVTLETANKSVAIWALPRDSNVAQLPSFRRDQYGLPDYQAEQQFLRQTGPTGTASGYSRILTRLNEYAERRGGEGFSGELVSRWRARLIIVAFALGVLGLTALVLPF